MSSMPSTRCGACDARAGALPDHGPVAGALPRRRGTVRQAGRFDRKGDARAAIRTAEAVLGEAPSRGTVSLLEFFEEWDQRFPRHPRTMATSQERLRLYILPHLLHRGDLALGEIRRPTLRDVQNTLLRRGLAKETIDGAFSSLSALLSDTRSRR